MGWYKRYENSVLSWSRRCTGLEEMEKEWGNWLTVFTWQMVTKMVHACVYLVAMNFTNAHLYPMQAEDEKKLDHTMMLIFTWRPVGTCLASFTLAKLPRPIVLIRRYLPICCTSSGGFACPEITCRAFSPDAWFYRQLHITNNEKFERWNWIMTYHYSTAISNTLCYIHYY